MFSFFRFLPNGAMYPAGKTRPMRDVNHENRFQKKHAGVKNAQEQFIDAENHFTEKTIFKQIKN